MSRKPANFTSTQREAKLFDHPFLQFLTKTHISVPLIIFFGAGVVLTYLGYFEHHLSILAIVSYFFVGMLSFTLVEYLMHRYIYHLPGVYEEGKVPFAIHGIHHKHPKDKKILVMPPVLSVLISSLIFGINYLLMGKNGFPFTGGFLFGYAAYLCVHYIVHAVKPPKNFLKQLWINHSIHHYQDDEKAFGVSSPLWDYVFGTMPDKKNKPKIAKKV